MCFIDMNDLPEKDPQTHFYTFVSLVERLDLKRLQLLENTSTWLTHICDALIYPSSSSSLLKEHMHTSPHWFKCTLSHSLTYTDSVKRSIYPFLPRQQWPCDRKLVKRCSIMSQVGRQLICVRIPILIASEMLPLCCLFFVFGYLVKQTVKMQVFDYTIGD